MQAVHYGFESLVAGPGESGQKVWKRKRMFGLPENYLALGVVCLCFRRRLLDPSPPWRSSIFPEPLASLPPT